MTANFRNPPGRFQIPPIAPPKGHSTTPKSYGLCDVVNVIYISLCLCAHYLPLEGELKREDLNDSNL